MKTVLLLALVVGSVSSAAAQTNNSRPSGVADCKLKLSQAPVIRGIHVGMSIDQALGIFSEPDKVDDMRRRLNGARFGLQGTGLNPGTTVAKEKFVGVNYVNLGFFDGELFFFNVVYDGPHWTDVDQFAARVAETLNLPRFETWRTSGISKILSCDGFDVSVELRSEDHGPSIKVTNREKDVDKIVREREEAQRQSARRAFKP